ncbi:pirin family protein [Demequina iriomotensis]|uniref:pirin family protein n=1 Tax=Demequina iriomotensis TaxID=1536641 RepID=UPI0007831EC4|nr:pirin family protein [Demequina iriomotensis]
MTRLDAGPVAEVLCPGTGRPPGPVAVVLEAREVPLGGLRAMSVRRSLPQRGLTTIGAWCFLDRFGPQLATMRVEPHPHMGLQTVTWPLAGEIRHRDSLGSDVVLRPGALNLMTAGHGVSHSEYSVGEGPVPLDALQLWVALPGGARGVPAAFETHATLPTLVLDGGATATVILGTLAGTRSPATAFTPIVGAQVVLDRDADAELPLDPTWEHGIIPLSGDVEVHDASGALTTPDPGGILYLGADRSAVTLRSRAGGTLMVLGGEPFPEDLVMWWNFVGRDHDEIVEAWHAWNGDDGRFGTVDGHGDVRIPAPPMPEVRLKPRTRG